MEFAFRAGYAADMWAETDMETAVYGWMQTRAAAYLDEAMSDPDHPRYLARAAEAFNEVAGREFFRVVPVPMGGIPQDLPPKLAERIAAAVDVAYAVLGYPRPAGHPADPVQLEASEDPRDYDDPADRLALALEEVEHEDVTEGTGPSAWSSRIASPGAQPTHGLWCSCTGPGCPVCAFLGTPPAEQDGSDASHTGQTLTADKVHLSEVRNTPPPAETNPGPVGNSASDRVVPPWQKDLIHKIISNPDTSPVLLTPPVQGVPSRPKPVENCRTLATHPGWPDAGPTVSHAFASVAVGTPCQCGQEVIGADGQVEDAPDPVGRPRAVAINWGRQTHAPAVVEVDGDPRAADIESVRAELAAADPTARPVAGFLLIASRKAAAADSSLVGLARLYPFEGDGPSRVVCGDRQEWCVCTQKIDHAAGVHECPCGGSWTRGPGGEFEPVTFPSGPGDNPAFLPDPFPAAESVRAVLERLASTMEVPFEDLLARYESNPFRIIDDPVRDVETSPEMRQKILDWYEQLPADVAAADATAQRISEYENRIARWADRLAAAAPLTDDQAQGFACVACGHNLMAVSGPAVVVGYGTPGISSHLFACETCDQAGED